MLARIFVGRLVLSDKVVLGMVSISLSRRCFVASFKAQNPSSKFPLDLGPAIDPHWNDHLQNFIINNLL